MTRVGADRRLRAVVSMAATVLAAFAISYFAHLNITGADATTGLLATLAASGSACSLQDMLVAVPFGLLLWLEAPPFGRERPKSVCLLAFVIDACICASAVMSSTHHLSSLYADCSHAILSLLFFAVLWLYLFYALRLAFCKFSTFAAGLFVNSPSTDAPDPSLAAFDDARENDADSSGRLNTPSARVDGSQAALMAGVGVGTKFTAGTDSCSKIFFVSMLVLLIAWSPYVISMAPGSDCPDMASQLAQFVNGDYSSHHPLYATFVYGTVYSLGSAIAGANAGLLAMMLFQTLALALALSLEVVELAKMRFSRSACIAALVFFAVVPVFGSYCQWLVKDSLFGACFALYVTVYIRCCLRAEAGGVSERDIALLLGASLLASLLRNNAFYVVAFAAIAFALVFRKKLNAAKVVWLLAVIPMAIGLSQVAIIGTDAQKGDIREALSIPFQQTARYAAEHSGDITDEEKQAIDAVLDYSDLSDRYRWYISDPVKNKAMTDNKTALVEYFKVWAAQGLRHPVCYVDSFLDQSFGYWSLASPEIYGREFADFANAWAAQSLDVTTGYFFPELVGGAKKAVVALRDMPFLGIFSIAGFYTLVGLVLAALALYRGKPRAVILLVPSAVLLLTCIAGPLNGSIRYSFGNIAAFPVVAGAVLFVLYGRDSVSPRQHVDGD